MSSKQNSHYKKTYIEEKSPADYQGVAEEQLKKGKIRRRKEDLEEGLRLDREVFNDFPDMPN